MRFAWKEKPRGDDPLETRRLLEDLWGQSLRQLDRAYINHCYVNHYKRLLRTSKLIDGSKLRKPRREDVVQLVTQLKLLRNSRVEDFKTEIQQRQPPWPWMSQPCDEETAERAISFATQMVLFVKPKLENTAITLESAVKTALPNKCPKLKGQLSADFSAKNLARKGGMRIEWTSRLDEHLTFAYDTKDHLRIFRHQTAIEQYCNSAECAFYPKDFLEETAATMALLYNPGGQKSIRRLRAIAKSEDVDIEAQTSGPASRELKSYPYWGKNLLEVQRRYNATKPKKLKQWWYDRRDKTGWVTLLVAIVVFILTVVFGVISSVTSIMQVIKT